ncbi:MAG: cytochrome c-type biogenesis protein CcmH [Anaerolineae bacterium]|nr:cytochrome c-type biogenesis protein CcmH [Anaerolineae bacterium]
MMIIKSMQGIALFTVYCLLFTVFFLHPATLHAQEPTYEEITKVAEQLNCPTCQGRNLADCDTVTCAQWRGQISDLLVEGYNEQEVLDYFVANYGVQVLQEPPRSGFTLILWVLPVILLLIGGGWLAYTMRDWTNQPATPVTITSSTAGPTVPRSKPEDYLRQVERDLGLDED